MNHTAPLGLENTLNYQGYKHPAPLALSAWQTRVDALKRLQAETAAELDALLPSILEKTLKGEL
jgi:hypothetical protein